VVLLLDGAQPKLFAPAADVKHLTHLGLEEASQPNRLRANAAGLVWRHGRGR
jgi:hypothetical protein